MYKLVIFFYTFVLLKCSYARPDLSLGYRYNQQHGSGGGAFLQAPILTDTSYSPTASGNSYFPPQPCVGSSGFVPSTQLNNQFDFDDFRHQTKNVDTSSGFTDGVGNFGGSTFNSGFGGNTLIGSGSLFPTQEGVPQNSVAPIVSKHFYVHTAPSDDNEQETVRHIQIGQPKKNYRVVFINTPSSHSTKAKIVAHIAPTEEKTAIYVLSKKNNALDINTEVSTPAPINNKPEVFFVKYKTPEEAIHAQHVIQSQYDALGGSSDISNEGQIKVSSVIGTLGGYNAGRDISPSASGINGAITPVTIPQTGINTQQTYLPANPKFKYK